MNLLYNLFIAIAQLLLPVAALFDSKLGLFLNGRNETFKLLEKNISKTDIVFWVHAASLGEFEQGRPIIEKFKKSNPTVKIVLTFFSPSGYEVRKNYDQADVVCYLPIDSKRNVKKFLDIIHPSHAVFVKYEFWPNLLNELKRRNISTILISGIFRKEQAFFNWYGQFMKKALTAFSYFFVQDQNSEDLLKSIGFNNVKACGDTRFDRVLEITQQDNSLDFIHKFVGDKHVLVAGSTWKEDEELLVEYINTKSDKQEKFIIAPHNIVGHEIETLKQSISKKVVLFSEMENKDLNEFDVFIADTIGILTKIYSYAHVAYVGGGYTKSGVHNVLEPASYGVPVLIGPNFRKFNEAKQLVANGGCLVVDTQEKLCLTLQEFVRDEARLKEVSDISYNYVKSKTGATDQILKYLNS